jgi:hypothetical protein
MDNTARRIFWQLPFRSLPLEINTYHPLPAFLPFRILTPLPFSLLNNTTIRTHDARQNKAPE